MVSGKKQSDFLERRRAILRENRAIPGKKKSNPREEIDEFPGRNRAFVRGQ